MVKVGRGSYYFDDACVYPRKKLNPQIYILECLSPILCGVKDRIVRVSDAPWVDERIKEQNLIRVDRVPDDTPPEILSAVVSDVES